MPLMQLMKSFLGTSNESLCKAYRPMVAQVNALEEEMQQLDDGQLRERSAALKQRVRDDGASLESIKIEAFALLRETADRRLGMMNAVLGTKPGFELEWFGLEGENARAAVDQVRQAVQDGAKITELDLPASVYAVIRERFPVSAPPFRMRAHDVQVLGAGVLNDGRIAEMKTGEGKTLVASFASYLNGLTGKGVHIVTVNDYLAQRDADWNRPTLEFLGLTIGAIQSQMDPAQRHSEYGCDITYGTNNEFGFDYLRDNLKQRLEDQVQKRHTFVIVDEVDSVLIDEARTPLIISGPARSHEESTRKADEVARQLSAEEHFEIDIKDRHVTLNEEGMEKAAELFGVPNMYDAESMHLPHFLDNALKAHHLYHRDKEYLVKGQDVMIVDEFTGRAMPGRRWSDGLHQAIEAKEGVDIQAENQTYATITLQNYFRLYDKLSGMTGTATTEAQEFNDIYKLQTVAIPTNRPIVRRDMADLVYGSLLEKFNAIVDEVAELHAMGQPILVGTITVEMSEQLSEQFTRKGIKHNVLNARQHEREADIVKNAGQLGGVTIATNMAGRGTDIVLGSASGKVLLKHWAKQGLAPKKLKPDSPELDEACIDMWCGRYLDEKQAERVKDASSEAKLSAVNDSRRQMGWDPLPLPSSLMEGVNVRQLGGLRIIGTERHESRRIDNQLRGRSGRQGDPGSSRFYLSLDDDLMKRFAGPRLGNLMRSLGLKDGVPIESKMVSRSVEKAQKRVEEYHYGMRKNLLEYDQVMNLQRKQIYGQRQRILEGEDLRSFLLDFVEKALDDLVQGAAADGTRGEALAQRIAEQFHEHTGLEAPPVDEIPVKTGGEACREVLMARCRTAVDAKLDEYGEDLLGQVLRFVLLETIDRRWKDHLYAMDHLRHAIGLESYGQKDPKLRYKEEGYRLFLAMYELIRADVARVFFRLQVEVKQPAAAQRTSQAEQNLQLGGFVPKGQEKSGQSASPSDETRPSLKAPRPDPSPAMVSSDNKPKPTDPCPCGSGLAYAECHGF